MRAFVALTFFAAAAAAVAADSLRTYVCARARAHKTRFQNTRTGLLRAVVARAHNRV